MKRYCFLFLMLFSTGSQSQTDSTKIDTKYLEDQFYLGVTYNLLINKPSRVNQYNLSRGLHLGYVRDIPLNEQRNFGIGIGAGYSYSLVYTNIEAIRSKSGEMLYDIISVSDRKVIKSYYQYHSVDFIPFEIRWRTSTPTTFQFWRIYSGVKVSYLFGSNYRLKTETEKIYLKSPDTQNYFDWKVYVAIGRGSWNGYIQYGFTPLLKGKKTQSGTPVDMNLINIGFIFYIS